jgi:cell division protein FtsW
MAEPDMGTTMVITFAVAATLVAAGARPVDLGKIALVIGALALLMAVIEPYRMARLTAFLNPTADAAGAGFQAAQAKIALGSGGLFGVGIGNGVQKARDNYSKILVAGLTSLILVQATINLFAVMGLAPLTGVPLPFVSYGNSSLMACLFSVGLILNVAGGGRAAARKSTPTRAGKLRVVEGGRSPARERSRASGARKAKSGGGGGGNRGARRARHGGRRRASG